MARFSTALDIERVGCKLSQCRSSSEKFNESIHASNFLQGISIGVSFFGNLKSKASHSLQ